MSTTSFVQNPIIKESGIPFINGPLPKKSFSNVRGTILIVAVLLGTMAFKWIVPATDLSRILSYSIMAYAWNLFWAFTFVGSIYFWKYDEPLSASLRDRPQVILQRFASITTVTFCFVLVTPATWSEIGIPSSILQHLKGAILGVAISAILYCGHLVFGYFETGVLHSIAVDLQTFRSIIFAPVFEEIFFRSCMIPIMIHAGWGHTSAILITPVFFGLAHVHHILNNEDEASKTLTIAGKRISIRIIYIKTIIQACYTTLFGIMSSFYFVRTGTLAAPVTAHIFCNQMGVPAVDFLDHPKKILIGIAYVAGIIAYFSLLGPLTTPSWYF